MQKVRKVLDKLILLERYICCALLVIIMAICFGSVVMRYVFSRPWSWSEEVIIVFLLWFGFLCMSIETYHDRNIAITGIYSRLPTPARKALDILRHGLLCAFFFLMTKDSWQIFLLNITKRLPASHWNQGLQFFPMLLGGALMLLFSVVNIVGVLVGEVREPPEEDAQARAKDKTAKGGGTK